MNGGDAPTIGLLGRLGGIGARPERIGFVSDGDGALCAVALAAKLLDMQNKGDILDGDVFISTHICPDAPTAPHDPVPFMGSPVEMSQVNREEVSPELDAILSVDTTKGNRVINTRGFAISPTVKEGYILRTSEDLLELMQITTGKLPRVRKDLGEPPLVTPSSQIVGTQAVFNVLMGERYKMVTKETKDILSGKYGATVKPFNEDVQKKCIGDTQPITCRPADLLDNELDKLEGEMAQYKKQDEDVLSYALFPQVATEFFKYRQAQETKVDETAADTKNGAYPV